MTDIFDSCFSGFWAGIFSSSNAIIVSKRAKSCIGESWVEMITKILSCIFIAKAQEHKIISRAKENKHQATDEWEETHKFDE